MVKTYLPCLLLLCAAPVFAKPTLTVYTYDSFAADWGPGPAVKSLEAECDCELKFVALEDGVSLLNRLRMEGKTAPPTWCWGWTTTCCRRRSKPACSRRAASTPPN